MDRSASAYGPVVYFGHRFRFGRVGVAARHVVSVSKWYAVRCFGSDDMRLFHSHRWVVESTHFTPPLEKYTIDNFRGYGPVLEKLFRRSHEGVTNVYMRCVVCGELKETSMYGEYKPPVK